MNVEVVILRVLVEDCPLFRRHTQAVKMEVSRLGELIVQGDRHLASAMEAPDGRDVLPVVKHALKRVAGDRVIRGSANHINVELPILTSMGGVAKAGWPSPDCPRDELTYEVILPAKGVIV